MALTDKLTAIADAIRSKTGGAEALTLDQMPTEIAGIETGGGSSADLCYVTFVSYDGSVEYGKKAVAVGDDCADPIARGVFDTPTRDSDAQYNYTFYGWATEVNGAADSTWNKSVTEDRTVYANFVSAVRYYTVTYYDDDGATVLKTESKAYGSTPGYTPIKDGYTFVSWTPSLETVTGNASYTATWEEKLTFAGSSWAKIAEISDAGEAQKYFSVGDSKTITLTNGEELTVKIAGFDHDLISGSEKTAGISMICETTSTMTLSYFDLVRTGITSSFTQYIPTEIRTVVKTVDKSVDSSKSSSCSIASKSMTFWVPSVTELGRPYTDYTTAATAANTLGNTYELYSGSTPEGLKRYQSDGSVATYFTRNYYLVGSGAFVYHNGSRLATKSSGSFHVLFGFCI